MSSPTIPMLTGKPIPQVGFGTSRAPKGQLSEAICAAVDAGYRHIDTARVYHNEGVIGETIEKMIKSEKVTREEMFITTKLSGAAALPSRARQQTEICLKLLRTEYIDLLLIHHPMIFSDLKLDEDPPVFYPQDDAGDWVATDTDPLESYREMEKLVDAGLVKALGLSNFNKDQIQKVWDGARIKPSNLQIECHAWLPNYELVDFCQEKGITVTAYAPIGSPGRPERKGAPDSQILLKDPVVNDLARKVNKTPAQVLLRYLIQRGIIPLPKSVNRERIISNIQLFNFTLSDEQMEQLKRINRRHCFFPLTRFHNLLTHPQCPHGIAAD